MTMVETAPSAGGPEVAVHAPTIAVESPLQDDVRELIAELNAYLLPLSPVEFQFKMTAEEIASPDTTMFLARDAAGIAVACGALKVHPGAFAEVKRMYTRPGQRGRGTGAAILAAIEARALSLGVTTLMLETGEGPGFADACRLYERNGFRRRGAYLDYPDSGWSRFYEKSIA